MPKAQLPEQLRNDACTEKMRTMVSDTCSKWELQKASNAHLISS